MATRTVDESWGIPIGAPVYDIEGQRIGHVRGADNLDLRVERGIILRHTCYVGLNTVDRVEDGRVILSVTKDEAIDD
jgi:hypothetical protein